MTFPQVPLSTPQFTNGFVDATLLESLITARFNQLQAAVSLGLLGFQNSTGTVTLTNTNAFAGLGTVTFPLASTRTVFIFTMSCYRLGTSSGGRMTVQSAYNSGTTANAGSSTVVGSVGHVYNNSGVSGLNGSDSGYCFGTGRLTAGTYTAYPLVTRANGGDPSDVASGFGTIVLDIGP